jgi:hypothetical protein
MVLNIDFYNSSEGGCTAGVGTWADNEKLQAVPSQRERREEYENGMDEGASSMVLCRGLFHLTYACSRSD